MLRKAISSMYAVITATFLAACSIEPPAGISESLVAPAQRAAGAQTCPAGKEWELPVGQDVRIRIIEVRRLSEQNANFLAIMACIDTIYPMAGDVAAGVFNPHGQLVLVAGQRVARPQPSGTSYTYSFGAEWPRVDAEAMREPYAHKVLLQMPLGQPDSHGNLQHQTTVSILQRARFIGLAARPFGHIEPDACLAPAAYTPAPRDPKMLLVTHLEKRTLTMLGCVVGRRMSGANLSYRPLWGVVGQKPGDPRFQALTEFNGTGNTARGLSPVRGLQGLRMIALLAAQWPATEPVYELIPLEATADGCAEPAGHACTPNGIPSFSVVGVQLRR